MDPQVIRLDSDRVGFAYSTDWHLTDTPPGRRTGNYVEEILAKVEFVGNLAHQIGGVHLCGGDVFHVKSPDSRSNSFSLERRISLAMQISPLHKVFGAIGNHDIFQDLMSSLPKQPLGSLIASGVYHDLSAQHIIFENKSGSVRVLVEAFPYADDEVTLATVLAAPPRPEGVTHRIAIMHQYGHTGGAGLMFGHRTIGYNELADVDYDVMLWGHDHSREKTVQVGNVLHVRLGSLSRASLSGDEINRPVSAALLVFDEERVRFQEKEIPVKPLELAFVHADKPMERTRDHEDVNSFFEGLETAVTGIQSSDPRTVLRQLAGDDLALADLACELCNLS
jgi:DNA repair exonuclease SbcCD nuclease subunit